MTRKEFRQYRKMVKKYRKQLHKVVKQWAPYDYVDMIQLVYISLQGIQEYYHKGINVWSMESKEWRDPNMPTREEICNMLIKAFNKWMKGENLEDNLDEFFDLLKEYIYELWD